MATLEEKIGAFTGLLGQGVITSDEFSRIVAVLNQSAQEAEKEVSPVERYYNECFRTKIINVYKSPSTCKWPPLEPSMIKEGIVNIWNGKRFEDRNVRYIETYIDATNSYGAYQRGKLRIVIDSAGKPELVLRPANGNLLTPTANFLANLGGKMLHASNDPWEPMPGVYLS